VKNNCENPGTSRNVPGKNTVKIPQKSLDVPVKNMLKSWNVQSQWMLCLSCHDVAAAALEVQMGAKMTI